MSKHIFTIKGMHCASCKILIEEDLKALEGIKSIDVDYKTGKAMVEFDEQKLSLQNVYAKIKALNYFPCEIASNEIQGQKQKINFGYIYIVLLGFVIILGYGLVEYLDGFAVLANLTSGYEVGYGIIFLIGLLAGFHCIGMCGSIVVSYSTLCLDENKKSLWPHWQYNIGRIISYTIIGAILGGFGAFFGVNPVFNGIVTVIASILMFFLGITLLTGWSLAQKLNIKTPQFIARYIFSQKNKKSAPFIIGLINGFMPCGPLQAMQLYALTSGSFLKGAFSMLVFSLGTTILMFGFGAFLSYISQKQIRNLLKLSAILVIILSLFMFMRGLSNWGINFNVSNYFNNQNINENINSNTVGNFQEIKMNVTYYGYEPNVLTIKKGLPVRWIINVKQLSGCLSQILLPEYGIKKNLQPGQNIIEFTPTKTGELKFSCGMKMIWGKFIIN